MKNLSQQSEGGCPGMEYPQKLNLTSSAFAIALGVNSEVLRGFLL